MCYMSLSFRREERELSRGLRGLRGFNPWNPRNPRLSSLGKQPMSVVRQFLTQPQRNWLRRALFQVHLWTGIGVGLYVVVISVSGSAVVFRQDIYRAIETPIVTVEGNGERLTVGQLKEVVERAWPGYEVIQVYEDESNPKRAIELTFEKGWSRKQRLFDPYTGADLGAAIPWPIRAVSFFEELHFNLFGGNTGRKI